MEIYKTYKHNPPHLFRSNAKYFITGAIYEKKYFLTEESAKLRMIESINKGFSDNNWKLEDWVILHNHYHLIVEAPDRAETLSGIMQNIHKFTAMWIKKNIASAKNEDKIWWNYWDTCLTYEKSYFARLNYLWNNPLKHCLVEDPKDWKFGSYFHRFKNNPEYLNEMKHPFDMVKVFDDF
jgi:putative transposase